MESLKNSHNRGYDMKLRRTDQALHETTQRFVESLGNDTRISQYADINFAAKLMERDTWYWLTPFTSGRAGYLVFQPNLPAIWMDEQCKQSYRIPIRVSALIYEKKSVFLASLDRVDGILRLEDVWLLAGDMIRPQSFTKRWEHLCQFSQTSYREDGTLQNGLRITMATYEPLVAAQTWVNTPTMMYAQSEKGLRRLRVQLQEAVTKPNTPPITNPKPYPKRIEKPRVKENLPSTTNIAAAFVNDNTDISNEEKVEKIQKTNVNQSEAIAIAHDEYPDTYDLWINGVKQGYAAVQDLLLSRKLRNAVKVEKGSKEKKQVNVRIHWNDEFKMYQIQDILVP